MASPEHGTVSTQANQQPDHGANDPIIGKVIDGCRIQRKLGQGGMGVVYLAEHDSLHQPFVIKILNPALVGAEDTVERFFREAQACAQLNHTGIVAIQNVGQEGEYYFIRMEYIEGKTLEDTIKDKNQFEWRHAVQVIVDTADALSHAHQKGMIHRDIKPENIMITPQGQVKVMDFGLAKHVHSSAKVSVTGQIVGTPFFMSPEQAGGKPTDARSDIYSLGVTLYYMLTGVKPFNGKNLQEIFLKHFFYAPESPKIYNADLPEALCEVVKKCLKKKKKERYQSAKDLVKDLRTVLDDPDARINADAATESQSGEGGGEGKDADFGKTIRAQQQEEGGKTVVAQADKTVVAGQQVADGTVRVMDEGGGATVRVGEKRGDNDVTVAVKLTADGAKIEEDEEHPAAGLDLPTTMINQLGLDTKGVALKPSGGGGAVVVGANKTKLAIVAAIVAVPLLLLGANEVRARGAFEDLKDRWESELNDATPDALRAFAQECDEAPTGLLLDSVKLTAMSTQARSLADTREQKAHEDKKARDAEDARAKAEAEKRAERDRLYKEAQTKLTALEGERAAKRFRKYTEEALAFVATYEQFGDLTSGVQIPVMVGTDPEGAELFLVGENGVETPTPDRSPAVVWVRPNKDYVIKVRKLGFVEETLPGTANAYIDPVELDLKRKLLREVSLGDAQVTIGVRQRVEPLTPASQPAVDQSTGDIYWVSHDGTLRALNVKRGQPAWKFNLGEHRVGLYGDPTPSPSVVPGQVVLASSLLGRLSAHRPANDGIRIWTIEAGAPVTSPTAFLNKGNEAIVAAGTSTGEVVFVLGSQVYWRFRTQNVVVSAPYLQGDLAFVGSTDDRLYALDYARRLELGSIDLGADVIDGPRAIGRNLVCVTADGVVHVVDVTTPSAMREIAALGDKVEVRPGQGVEVVADRIYASVGREVRAYVVSASGVKACWATPFTCPSNVTRVALSGDALYVGGQSGFLYALDRTTGEKRWSHPVPGGQISFAPFVIDQELFVFAGGRIVVLQAD